jgi:hypothetical protein
MSKLNELAQAYVPQQTLNISELDQIPVDVDVTVEEHTDKEGEVFKVNIATINNKKYRIPNSVIEGLKGLLNKMPNLKVFTVLKTGQGMGTKYQVLPAEQKVN